MVGTRTSDFIARMFKKRNLESLHCWRMNHDGGILTDNTATELDASGVLVHVEAKRVLP